MNIHPYWLIIFSAIAGIIPVSMALVTSYMKVSIVLSMLRNGLGTQQVPSAIVIMALSFSLTALIMAPVIEESVTALRKQKMPPLDNAPSLEMLRSYAGVLEPWKRFMEFQTGVKEKEFFSRIVQQLKVHNNKENGEFSTVLDGTELSATVPAFMFSELKEAFAMAFVVMLPFLVIDLIVANVLVGLGMYMVSPVMIALPLKLLLFVISDAWLLLARGLIESYGMY